MRYLIDGQIVTLRAGSLLFAYAGQAHVLLSETRNFDMWVFLISGSLLAQRARGASMPPLTRHEAGDNLGPRLLSPEATEELFTLATQIAGTTDETLQEIGLKWFLGRAWSHWKTAGGGRTDHIHPCVDIAVRAIRRNPALTLSELAQMAGVTPGRLGKLFRAEIGEGIVTFRNKTRLRRVDEFLAKAPDRNLLEAGLEAGFGSYPQFYRVFRQLRGEAPYVYYSQQWRGTG